MRILIDLQGAQTIGSRSRGIGRYSMAFTKYLAIAARKNGAEVHVALNGKFPETIDSIRQNLAPYIRESGFGIYNTPEISSDFPTTSDPMVKIGGILSKYHFATHEPHALVTMTTFEGTGRGDLCPSQIDLPGVVTSAILYDLTPFRLPEKFMINDQWKAYWNKQKDVMASNDLLLAISEASRQDGLKEFGLRERQIVNISGAVSDIFHNLPKRLRPKNMPTQQYILIVGSDDPNKNLIQAIQGYAKISKDLQRTHPLVHVGYLSAKGKATFKQNMRDAGVHDIIFLGRVNDRALIDIYDHAHVLIFPSLYEGFGLPVLEAMTRGTATLASNSTSLPEIVGRDDLMFDPNDPNDLAEKLTHLLENDSAHSDAVQWAQKRAKAFSWEAVGTAAFKAISERVRQEHGNGALRRKPPSYTIEEALSDAAKVLGQNNLSKKAKSTVDQLILNGRLGDEIGPPRLLVDVTMINADNQRTGIQRVVKETVSTFLKLQKSNEIRQIVPFTLPEQSSDGKLLTAVDFLGTNVDHNLIDGEPINLRTGDVLLLIDSTWDRYDEFSPYISELQKLGGQVFSVVYDLVPYLHPETTVSIIQDIYDKWLRSALVKSDGLICISQTVANELVKYVRQHKLPHNKNLRVSWWHMGADLPAPHADTKNDTVSENIKTALEGSDPAFLMVGTLEPRKRHEVALDAMDLLWQTNPDARLVLIGKEGWNVDGLTARIKAHPKLGKQLFWFEKVEDHEIVYAYNKASALIFASIYEGYGLPVVEAAASGLPVIASDIPVLREVGGDGALYFKCEDPESLAGQLSSFLDGNRPDPKKVNWQSWDQSAEQLWDVLFAARTHAFL